MTKDSRQRRVGEMPVDASKADIRFAHKAKMAARRKMRTLKVPTRPGVDPSPSKNSDPAYRTSIWPAGKTVTAGRTARIHVPPVAAEAPKPKRARKSAPKKEAT